MRKLLVSIALVSALSLEAFACHPQTGDRIQRAFFSWGAESLSHQTPVGSEFSFTKLPSGHTLALRVSPATEAVYREQFQWRDHNVELTYVEIFDASSQPYEPVYASLWGQIPLRPFRQQPCRKMWLISCGSTCQSRSVSRQRQRKLPATPANYAFKRTAGTGLGVS